MTTPTHIIDSVSSVDSRHVAKAAVGVLDRIQGEPAGVQIQTFAMLFLILSEQFDVDIRDELARAERVMRDADDFYKPEVRALREYVRGELS